MNLTLGNTAVLIERARRVGMLRNQLAYVLATAYWETGRTMEPVKEAYYLAGKIKDLENWRKIHLRYYPWYGRGYVQLTWLKNYIKSGKELDIDLTTDPDTALDPTIAADICIAGMREGWFTGKKLSDYITLKKSDFKNARRIINGMDEASTIEDFAKEYDKLLKEAGYGETTTPFKPTEKPAGSIPITPGISTPTDTKPSVKPSFAILEGINQILILIAKLFGAKV